MADHLAELYDAHAAWMYRYAVVVLADPLAAEDAVQQVFVKLAHPRKSKPDLSPGEGPGPPGKIKHAEAYLRTAVRNECYQMLDRRRREPAQSLEGAALIVQPITSNEDDAELARALSAALRGLPVDQREVVHLKVYEGLTFERIGEVLGVSPNTAASRYRYALDKLRRELERKTATR